MGIHDHSSALLVGIDCYEKKHITPLRGAKNDARTLVSTLTDHLGFPPERVRSLTDGEAEISEFGIALENAAGQTSSESLLLLFFAGHGFRLAGTKDDYLVFYDSDIRNKTNRKRTCFPVAHLEKVLCSSAAHRVLVLLDACRKPVEKGRSVEEPTLPKDFARGGIGVSPAASPSAQQEIATVFSCKPGNSAYESDEQDRGFFSLGLEQALSGEAADPRGRLTLNGLERFLQKRVAKLVHHERGHSTVQVPWFRREGACDWLLGKFASSTADEDPQKNDRQREYEPTQEENRQREYKPIQKEDQQREYGPTGERKGGEIRRVAGVEVAYIPPAPGQHGFWMQTTPISQRLWRKVMLKSPHCRFKKLELPVESVSWDEVQAFITEINRQTGCHFRLPEEAEWEHAARAGSKHRYHFGKLISALPPYAWYEKRKTGQVEPCPRKPNAWGLRDVHGNVYEWCAAERSSTDEGSHRNGAGRLRPVRGGSWKSYASECTATSRRVMETDACSDEVGFRLLVEESEELRRHFSTGEESGLIRA
ncbi:MAG: SUMF1/EgtB/PvdO family nonheme iron enzyme [Gemmatimonadetes bacterium]|jgi:hypothetical protein|nr:SUMF1/EgtB/PvdO family nonheme iron enzyme [Gemmatimonadota bacterium]